MLPFLNKKYQREKGQFFTPKEIVKSILDRMKPYIVKNQNNHKICILDPAMGEGIFFKSLIPILSEVSSGVELYGIDFDQKVLNSAKKELMSHLSNQQHRFHLLNSNFLLEPVFQGKIGKFDVCIGNPPHNARYSKSDWKIIRNHQNINFTQRFRAESSIFFVLKSLKYLKEDGILGFILSKPLIYSKRWLNFRNYLLNELNLIEVWDLGNQFSGQLQEQCFIIIKKQAPGNKYKTGFWNINEKKFESVGNINISEAHKFENLLVGVNENELRIIRRLYDNSFDFLKIQGFRGISSIYRSNSGHKQLIEKANLANGYVLPARSFLLEDTPLKLISRQMVPKILAQRIISYKTKPKFLFDLKILNDSEGTMISHETVINIISQYPKEHGYSNNAIAGILQSSLIEWWLRHAIYTKRFVTSKDFDRYYIQKIRVPKLNNEIDEKAREKFISFLKSHSYRDILILTKKQGKNDQIFFIGEIYQSFQFYGEQLKSYIKKFLLKTSTDVHKEHLFTHFKKIQRDILERSKNKYSNQTDLNNEIEIIKETHQLMNQLQQLMNKIVFLLYNITPKEEKIIHGEIN